MRSVISVFNKRIWMNEWMNNTESTAAVGWQSAASYDQVACCAGPKPILPCVSYQQDAIRFWFNLVFRGTTDCRCSIFTKRSRVSESGGGGTIPRQCHTIYLPGFLDHNKEPGIVYSLLQFQQTAKNKNMKILISGVRLTARALAYNNIFIIHMHNDIYTVGHKNTIFCHNFYNTWPISIEIDKQCLG